ncbi:hypothetical protein D3C75_724150 [compost metagenome]
MLGHEVDVLGAHALGGHDQVAFVLAILVIHENDHLALANVLDQLGDIVERHRHPLAEFVGKGPCGPLFSP